MNVTPEQIETMLVEYAETSAALDVLSIDRQAAVDSVMTPEIKAKLAEIDLEFAPQMDAAGAKARELQAAIKAGVLALGATVKGGGYTAVWTKGRVAWDDAALRGYAATHPELTQFRTVGEPSVSLRKSEK